jgi:predicted nucleic acid-binding protein
MAYLWDSNILRFYSTKHPVLYDNFSRVPSREVLIPVVVYAEQLSGRIDGLLKAEPQKLLLAQPRLRATQELLSGFAILYLDEPAIAAAGQIKKQIGTRKCYADIIAAQAISGRHTIVTRNISDFQGILPTGSLENWVDERVR